MTPPVLDPINTKLTWIIGLLVGIAGVIGTVLANPQAVAALVTLFSHPTLPAALAAAGLLLGVIALAIGKPPATSPAPPKGP